VDKTVEQKFLRNGQSAISERTNSTGQKTFLVAASEDRFLNKEAALISKALRTLALRLLPGDILDECMAVCEETLRNQAAKDPAGERKKLADAFAGMGVQPEALKSYLGHPLDSCSPAEIADLRKVYQTVKDGESTWQDVAEQRMRERMSGTAAPHPAADAAAKAEILASAAEQSQPAASAAQATPEADPLAEFKAALAAAKGPADKIKAMKLVAGLPAELQAQARDLFNAGTEGGDASA
jgi:hypothetical protein